jgi:hypothetical protein
VRAPHVLELFSPQNVVLDGTQDPCAGLAASNPLVAKCATLFGLTTAQVLAIEKNPANQYNGQTGATRTWIRKRPTPTPSASSRRHLPAGLQLLGRLFDIKVKDYISGIGPTSSSPLLSTPRTRSSVTWCTATPGLAVPVDRRLRAGHDAQHRRPAHQRVSTSTPATAPISRTSPREHGRHQPELRRHLARRAGHAEPAGRRLLDCAGYYGTICSVTGGLSSPNPEWRHKARLTWTTPFEYGDWFQGLLAQPAMAPLQQGDAGRLLVGSAAHNPGLQYATDKTLEAATTST